jgi:endonuclease YncB( thermonuclease family)
MNSTVLRLAFAALALWPYAPKARRVRLEGIDAPEKNQPFGERAKQFTSGQAFGKDVTVQVNDFDRYGRAVSVVTLPDGSVLNGNLVRVGFAWWYRQYAPDAKLLGDYEQEARATRRGLWATKSPVAPWAWREAREKKRREQKRREQEERINSAAISVRG